MIWFGSGKMAIIFCISFVLLLGLTVTILRRIGNQDGMKDSEGNKRLEKNENIIDYEPTDKIDQEIVPGAFCNENDKDRHCQEHGPQRFELQRRKEQQLLESPKIVINSKSEYEPKHLEKPFLFLGKLPNPQNDERHYLIFEKDIFEKLKNSLDWGIKTKRNRVEQGGTLLGHLASYDKEIYCFVDDILLADTAGSSVFVEFTSEMWAAMQNELAEINAVLNENEQLVIVGWFHTHPNKLPVFMSGTDMNTQRLNFSKEWQASLVMNPHMDKYRVFFGARAVEGKVVLTESSEMCRSVSR